MSILLLCFSEVGLTLIDRSPVNAFRRGKGSDFILPSDWPSPWYNKCSSLRCYYPNLPQSVPGIFQCQGKPDGRPCVGTYYVTIRQAKHVMDEHREWLAEDERKRQKTTSSSSNLKTRASKAKSLAPTLPEKDEKYRPALRKVKACRNLTASTKKASRVPQAPSRPPTPPPKEKPKPFLHRQVRRQTDTVAGNSTPSLLDNARVRINASVVGANPSSVSLLVGSPSRPQPPPMYTIHALPHSDPKPLRPSARPSGQPQSRRR